MTFTDITHEEMKHPCDLSNPSPITDGWCTEEELVSLNDGYAIVEIIELPRSMGWRMMSTVFDKPKQAKEWAIDNGYASEFGHIKQGYKVKRIAKEYE